MSARFKSVFPYREIGIDPRIFRPLIPITLIYQKRFAQTAALLDSGADYNLFHGDVATYLGIDLTSGIKRHIQGIKGSITGYGHKITLRVNAHRYKTKVIFSSQIPDNALAVLGNTGFFDHFRVEFNYPQKITLELPPRNSWSTFIHFILLSSTFVIRYS